MKFTLKQKITSYLKIVNVFIPLLLQKLDSLCINTALLCYYF
jgi:hypothetical protein